MNRDQFEQHLKARGLTVDVTLVILQHSSSGVELWKVGGSITHVRLVVIYRPDKPVDVYGLLDPARFGESVDKLVTLVGGTAPEQLH